MDAASERYVEQVAGQVLTEVGSSVTGIYLHGSAVLGGYDVRRSDLDVLVVVDGPLSAEQRSGIAAALTDERLRCPARGLELSVVTRDVAMHPSARPRFELHLSTAPEDRKVVDGVTGSGDPDLVLHFAVCRVTGRLVGPGRTPAAVFAEVPRPLVLAQLVDELDWALEHAPNEYAVLNACRAWKYAYDGSLVSKLAGGEWALRHVQSPTDGVLVTMAIARQRGLTTDTVNSVETAAFVAGVLVELRSVAG